MLYKLPEGSWLVDLLHLALGVVGIGQHWLGAGQNRSRHLKKAGSI